MTPSPLRRRVERASAEAAVFSLLARECADERVSRWARAEVERAHADLEGLRDAALGERTPCTRTS